MGERKLKGRGWVPSGEMGGGLVVGTNGTEQYRQNFKVEKNYKKFLKIPTIILHTPFFNYLVPLIRLIVVTLMYLYSRTP